MATKRSLSPAVQKLIERMQRINFGRIYHLRFRNGEPVWDPAPRADREYRFGGERGPRKEIGLQDFVLCKEVLELLEFMRIRQNGVISVLIIKHGLPFDMVLPDEDEPGIAV